MSDLSYMVRAEKTEILYESGLSSFTNKVNQNPQTLTLFRTVKWKKPTTAALFFSEPISCAVSVIVSTVKEPRLLHLLYI